MLDALTLDQMRTFIAVAEAGSFRAAAARLSRVQSAVSHAIANLEVQLGATLFDRSARRPTLTPQGQALLADVRAILLKVDAIAPGRAASAKVWNSGSRSRSTRSSRSVWPPRRSRICTPPIRRSACGCGRRRSERRSSRSATVGARSR